MLLSQKFQKYTLKKLQTGGGGARCAGAEFAFDYILNETAKTAAGVARSRSLPYHAL